jgi:hypothetical protein
MTTSPLQVIEQALEKEVRWYLGLVKDEKTKKAQKEVGVRHSILEDNIWSIHIVSETKLSFVAKGGTHVYIYVSGLNVVGGQTKILDKVFLRQLSSFVKKAVKETYKPQPLIGGEQLVQLRKFKLRNLQWKRDIAERVPGLIPKADLVIVNETCKTTWRAIGTDETFTMEYNSDNHEIALEKARAFLSQKVREIELAEIDEQIKQLAGAVTNETQGNGTGVNE